MKKLIVTMLAIAMLATTATAVAEGKGSQGPQGGPQQMAPQQGDRGQSGQGPHSGQDMRDRKSGGQGQQGQRPGARPQDGQNRYDQNRNDRLSDQFP